MPTTTSTTSTKATTDATYAENASSWARWVEYVDTDGTMTREEFEAMSIDEKMDLQRQAFGG